MPKSAHGDNGLAATKGSELTGRTRSSWPRIGTGGTKEACCGGRRPVCDGQRGRWQHDVNPVAQSEKSDSIDNQKNWADASVYRSEPRLGVRSFGYRGASAAIGHGAA
jgi:hypothetical protein